MTESNNTSEELPAELVAKLRRADALPPMITAKVDRALQQQTAMHFTAESPARLRAAPLWLAAAASVLVAVFFANVNFDSQRPFDNGALYADIDGSGQIDIADVLALARESGTLIDEARMEAFAMRIVALDMNEDPS